MGESGRALTCPHVGQADRQALARGLAGAARAGEIDAAVWAQALGVGVLQFAAFDDPRRLFRVAKAFVSGLTRAVVTRISPVARFSSTEPARARTSFAGAHLLSRLAWMRISARWRMSVLS